MNIFLEANKDHYYYYIVIAIVLNEIHDMFGDYTKNIQGLRVLAVMQPSREKVANKYI